MNTQHDLGTTGAKDDSTSLRGLRRTRASLQRTALLGALSALACTATLGCAAVEESEGPVDGAEAPAKVTMRLRSDSPAKAGKSGGESLGTAEQELNSGHGISYQGGAIMPFKTKVYLIKYGTWSDSDFSILSTFVQNYGGSPNYNLNVLYDDNSGSSVVNHVVLGGSTSDSYSKGTSLSDADVFTIVKSSISSGALPTDSDAVYFVLGASDVDATSGLCSEYCGWHTYGTYNNKTLKYSFIGNPSRCPSGCSAQTSSSPNGSPAVDGMVSILAHELEEATSDPKITAWIDSDGNENADKCAWTFGTTFTASNGSTANMMLNGHEYLVQQNWYNSGSGSCALTYGQLSAHGGSGGGRFDVGCASGEAAVGLWGRSGSLVDKVGLYCAAVNSDGSLGTSYSTTGYGGSGGSSFSASCPSGEVMVGLSGRSGSKVDQLGIKCSTPSNWKTSGTVQYTASAGGGSGGSSFSESCAQGHFFNRITGRSGTLVDQAQGACAKMWPY